MTLAIQHIEFTFFFTDDSNLSRTLNGHTDAIWGLAFTILKNRLISCSADGTVRLWDAAVNPACVGTYNREKGE